MQRKNQGREERIRKLYLWDLIIRVGNKNRSLSQLGYSLTTDTFSGLLPLNQSNTRHRQEFPGSLFCPSVQSLSTDLEFKVDFWQHSQNMAGGSSRIFGILQRMMVNSCGLKNQKKRVVASQLGWEVLIHPPYSLDIASLDFHLFRSSQNSLNGKYFHSLLRL